MPVVRYMTVAVLLTLGLASQVTPVEKVIGLLQGMKSDIEKEGVAEAVTYDKFACFCKDTTTTKSTSVTDGQDNIDKLSASVADNSALKAAASTAVLGLKTKKEGLSQDLTDTVARCAKEKAEYEGIAADLNKALTSLRSAIKGMSDKKAAMDNVKAASALLEVDTGLHETLELADAMGLVKAPKQKAFLQGFSSFLQQAVDPADANYKYRSSDIVDLLLSLKKDFSEEKESLDTEWGKSDTACKALKSSLGGKIETNTKETKSTSEKIEKLGGQIAEDRGKLVEAQDLMKDDELYLKDLTGRCEAKAVQWDQRSSMRAGEITALSTALKVLGDRVQGADTKVNSRVLLLTPKAPVVTTPKKEAATKPTVAKAAEPAKAADAKVSPSFLQKVSAHSQHLSVQEAKEQLAREQAVSAIRDAGLTLRSPILNALAMQVAADPFKKVKQLIQGLVERLIKESAGEATKKGFCDTEMGKATRDREFRWTRVNKLTAEIQVLQAKSDELTQDISSLTKNLEVLGKAVVESTKLRKEEKAENEAALETARGGLEAVKEALLVLRSFYKEAAKASFVQASPVDEDTAGAGFSGAYKGKQESSNAVLGLLETIASDFERTVRSTESQEKEAAESYVQFQRVNKVDIGGKSTKKELDEQDLKTTTQALVVKKADMKTNMDLVDDAVKTLMELKPTCVDTGMSYKDRVAKREEEVVALNKALCLLDTEKVEAACK